MALAGVMVPGKGNESGSKWYAELEPLASWMLLTVRTPDPVLEMVSGGSTPAPEHPAKASAVDSRRCPAAARRSA